MKEPDDVSAMLRLKALGWGTRRIAAELGCSRTTVRRWLKEGAWRRPPSPSRSKGLDGLEAWVEERFRRHAGNADVVRQELARREGRRGQPAHGRAGGGASAPGAARRGAGDGALRDPAGPAAADRLRPAARRDRRRSAAGVVLRGDARLFAPRPRPGLSRRAPGALVRGDGERLRGVRRRAGGGAARQCPRADPEPRRRPAARWCSTRSSTPSRATGASRCGPARRIGREPRARTSAASAT